MPSSKMERIAEEHDEESLLHSAEHKESQKVSVTSYGAFLVGNDNDGDSEDLRQKYEEMVRLQSNLSRC